MKREIIICDCCSAPVKWDECYAVPGQELPSRGLKRLEEWIEAISGRVSRLVCEEDFREYIEIVSSRKFNKVPADLREKAFKAGKQRAQEHLLLE